MFSFKNIYKGWIESLIGLAVIMIAFYLVATGKTDWTQTIIALGFGCTMLGLRLSRKGFGKIDSSGLTVIVFSLAVGGLGSCQKPQQSTKTTIKDSTYIVEHVRFDTVTIEGDSVKIFLDNPCPEGRFKPSFDELLKSIIQAKNKRSGIALKKSKSGGLEIDCACSAEQKIIQSKNLTIYHLMQESIDKEIVITKLEKQQITWFDKFCRWFFWVVIACFIGIMIVFVRRL